MRPVPLTAARLLVTLLLALLLAGCSGTEDTGDTGDAGTDGSTGTGGDLGAEATTAPAGDAATVTAGAAGPEADDATATVGPEGADGDTGEAADQVVVSRDGAFELAPPRGWSDVSDEVPEEIELAVREDSSSGDFFDNLVVASEEPIRDLEQAVERAAEEVAGEDGEHEVLEPTEVDGVPAHGYLVRRPSDGPDVAQVQRWLEHGDRTYVVTFSTVAEEGSDPAERLDGILTGWRWTGQDR